jgi:transcription-repair coupling factor (superfamily II helicase)
MKAIIELINKTENYQTIIKNLSPKTPYKITGLNNGAKALLLLTLKKKNNPLFIVCNSKEDEEMISSLLESFDIDYDVYPHFELSPYEQVLSDVNMLDKQYKVIEKLLTNKIKCIITNVKALSHKIMTPEDLKQNLLTIRNETIIAPEDLIEKIVRLGYKSDSSLERKGSFTKKGGAIFINPIGTRSAIRIDYFDELIESIKEFDIQEKKTFESLEVVTLYPAGRIIIPQKDHKNLIDMIMKKTMEQVIQIYSKGLTKQAEELRKKSDELVKVLDNYNYNEYTYSLFNQFYKNEASIIDYLNKDMIVIWSEFTSQSNLMRKSEENFEKTYTEKIDKGLIQNFFGRLYIPTEDILKKIRNYPQIRFSALPDMPNIQLQITGTNLPAFNNKFDDLIDYVKKSLSLNINIVAITAQPQRTLTIFKEKDCNAIYADHSEELLSNTVNILKGSISKGFIYPDTNTIFISDSELFGWTQRHVKKKNKEKHESGIKILKVQDINLDDYVVHELHGVGQYKGLRIVELEGRKREYFEIIYQKGDKLLVPVEQINLLSLYRGSNDHAPKLNKMGGAEWENLKSKVKDSLKNITADLIKLYAERISAKGFAFPPDTEWQAQMEDAFPYEETPDQLKAIIETKEDMERAKPMDRLICGDVGFGKTEVAIRAVFKAVMSGKQVAVIAPTTVLSQQLYDILHERFSPYPVKMAIINRFRTEKESKVIYENLKKGNLDIIVSTHKILLKTPEFFDLGLVVIDEEHKFGVAHKERLKQFKANLDVLTMSATPIPRTLYMSLSGARDMSLIETAPRNRFPIKTKLSPYSRELIKNAILQEIERGGQVYFVHNRVESLGRVNKELSEMFPDLNIGIAHGQLPEHELENVMLGFNNKEFDILLCTTIIESGLDIPSANTIIIDLVHLLGLAQLYQLRGRVGRSDIQAYAYFLYPEHQQLTEEARQRLQVIQDLSELGSGYQVALRDLEIRGVGDLLGSEQHGNVLSVGYDTYCQILEEAINELKPDDEKTSNFATNVIIDLNLPCYIPDNWIDDYRSKMQVYRRLAVVQDLDVLDEIRKELKGTYGEIPLVTDNLLNIVKVRVLASKLHIKTIKAIHKEIKISSSINEQDWKSFVNQDQNFIRWKWSLGDLITATTSSSESDLLLIEKLLSSLVDTKNKKNS